MSKSIRRLLTALMSAALLLSLLPAFTVAKAVGSTYTCDISKGSVSITGFNVNYTDASGTPLTLPFSADDTYIISGTTDTNTVSVSADVNITLQNAGIDVHTRDFVSAFNIGATTTVNLTLEGENTLISGLCCAGLHVPQDAKLIIDAASENDKLTATGGSSGSGIGANYDGGWTNGSSGGEIDIYGGTVTANGGNYGAGIGGSNGGTHGGNGGTVNIYGGKVIANGGFSGAGIGGGCGTSSTNGGYGGTVTISGGTVTATGGGGDAAGIGGSNGAVNQGTCVITGGSVNADVGTVYYDNTTTKTPAYKTEITVSTIGDQDVSYTVDGGSAAVDCRTLSSKLYLWLPAGSHGIDVKNSTDGYAANVTASSLATATASAYFKVNASGGTYSVDSGGNVTFPSSGGTYTVTGLTGSTPTAHTLAVSGTGTANITLSDVNIDVSGTNNTCAFDIRQSATVTLTLDGESYLKSGENCAGLHVPEDAHVIIDAASINEKLTSTGGDGSAGIGGSGDESSGKVTVNGGTVKAQGGECGAGIGTGFCNLLPLKESDTITVNNGIVEATGGGRGAGIGGGAGGGLSGMIINNGKVTATSGVMGAGIGGGDYGGMGSLTVNGGIVEASGIGGAGIGGGGTGGGGTAYTCDSVTINGGTVTATSNTGAGIGGGCYGPGCYDLTISGGTVIATTTGSARGAGIGAGFSNLVPDSGVCTITGGSVYVSPMGPTPTNGTDNGNQTVYLTTATVADAGSVAVSDALVTVLATSLSGYTYGTKDMYTDADGKLYLWMPSGAGVSEADSADVQYTAAAIASGLSGTLTPLTIDTITPGGTDIEISGNIAVTFSKAMDATMGSVSLNGGPALTGGTWSNSGRTYTVPYLGLSGSTIYTLTITGFKDTAGNTLATDTSHTFTTAAADIISPTVMANILKKLFKQHPDHKNDKTYSDIIDTSADTFYGKGYQDIYTRKPSIEKARKLLNWEPKIGLEKSMRLTLNSFLEENKDGEI